MKKWHPLVCPNCFRQWRCTKKKFLAEKLARSQRLDESHAATRSSPLPNLHLVHNPAHRTAVNQSTISSWMTWAMAWRYLTLTKWCMSVFVMLQSAVINAELSLESCPFEPLSKQPNHSEWNSTSCDLRTLDLILFCFYDGCYCTPWVRPVLFVVVRVSWIEQKGNFVESFCCILDAKRKCWWVHRAIKTEVTLQ